MRTLALALAGLLALGAAAEPERPRGPTLLVPAHPDSAPPESEPAPLLIPGRASPADSSVRTLAQRAQDSFTLGQRLEANGIPGSAIISYRNAVRFDPTIADANFRMGMLFAGAGQFAEAVRCFRAELEHHPGHHEANRQIGLSMARAGQADSAIAHLGGITRARPADGAAWHALGTAYLAAQKPKDAETAFRRALKLGPTTADELRDLGAAMAAQGRIVEARAQYRKALDLAPGDAASWINLGNLEARAGRAERALDCYRRAEAADSSFVPAFQAQIQTLHEAKRDAEAARVYHRWLDRHPDHHGARFDAIRLLDAMGREDEALALAEEGTTRVPDAGQAFVLLGMERRAGGDTRGALAALRRAVTLYQQNPAERERVLKTIAAMRASAPDSLRALFAADSAASAR